ncbi:MAG: (Fe-S)-binding protein, partial [Acidobacteriota bacterium]|nr:(Fe-S)-binding protein [Acidobacteriota bacterium]
MNERAASLSPLREKVRALSGGDIEKILSVFREKLDADAAVYLNSCVHCGLCADSCHYYLASGETESMPAAKLDLINRVFK